MKWNRWIARAVTLTAINQAPADRGERVIMMPEMKRTLLLSFLTAVFLVSCQNAASSCSPGTCRVTLEFSAPELTPEQGNTVPFSITLKSENGYAGR
jgi:hypothetical protein